MTGFDQSDGKCGTGDATDAGESVAHADARASNGGRVDLAAKMYKTVNAAMAELLPTKSATSLSVVFRVSNATEINTPRSWRA